MIDAHAHLNEIDDLDAVLARALNAGIARIIAVGMDVASNIATLAISRRFPQLVLPALGYHPWSITPAGMEENLSFIRENLAASIALGEVGLDYQAKVKKKIQQEVFARVLELAASHNKPVIVHTMFSQERSLRMLKETGVSRAVFHWYSGPLDLLKQILAQGYLVSATPALNYSPPHQAAISLAPLEQILLETDAPVEYQGKVSEPADLLITAREVSRVKSQPLETVKAITTANAQRFFGL